MSTAITLSEPLQAVPAEAFLGQVLPAVERHARFAFRYLLHEARDEKVAECVALAWSWFVRLVRRRKDATAFPGAIATFAAKWVQSGRGVCGQENGYDALSPTAHRRHGVTVERFREQGHEAAPWEEALWDNAQTPPPDAAAFRVDFPAWLATLTDRDRRLVEDLMLGHATNWAARKYGVTPGRVSQLRLEAFESWKLFHHEGD
jgi:hypothetical protein